MARFAVEHPDRQRWNRYAYVRNYPFRYASALQNLLQVVDGQRFAPSGGVYLHEGTVVRQDFGRETCPINGLGSNRLARAARRRYRLTAIRTCGGHGSPTDARNTVIHNGIVPNVVYSEGTQHDGHFVFVAEFLFRAVVKAQSYGGSFWRHRREAENESGSNT